jgi:hypothetical protein
MHEWLVIQIQGINSSKKLKVEIHDLWHNCRKPALLSAGRDASLLKLAAPRFRTTLRLARVVPSFQNFNRPSAI